MTIKFKDGVQMPGGKVFLEIPVNEIKIIKHENSHVFKIQIGSSKLGEFSENEAKKLFREFHALDKNQRVLALKLEDGPQGLQYTNTRLSNVDLNNSVSTKLHKKSLEVNPKTALLSGKNKI